jgi:3-hydroxyisobutyrate dehydrogenase-like beta-hydroxyacid dehydrogenase
MAANIATGGFELIVYDQAGTESRAPAGTKAAISLAEVAAAADSIFLSLPDGAVSLAVNQEIADLGERRATTVIDLSTIGPADARKAADILSAVGVNYIDAPVSGGQAGAKAGTITVMWAGPQPLLEQHRDILMAFCKNPFHVGDQPGQGQALKILNNFLSGTAMAATSEAILYGLSQGLEMETMLDVINVSTGQNTASRDKFPERIATGTYDAGFKTALLTKDIRLYLDNVRTAGMPDTVGETIAAIWEGGDSAMPDSDFTRIYEYIRDRDRDD